jgi:hypothetical protein
MGEAAQVLGLPDVDPGVEKIERHSISISDEGAASKTGAQC